MADQNFPGFEGDDEEPKQPAAPAKPAAGQAAKPATGKVAKGDAAPPSLQAAGKVDYAFEESEEPAEKPKKPHAEDTVREPTPATMQPVIGEKGKGKAAPKPAPVDEDVDPDLKPGSRKDLWNCPHCGAGNKPGRDTCRTCGKSPDDPVEAPWFKKPAALGGIGGGVALLIVIIVLLSGGADTSAKPAELDAIDSKPRIGGAASGTHDADTKTFTAKKRFAVVGRCLGSALSTTVNGSTTLVLVLGSGGKGDLGDATANFNGDITDVPNAPGKFIIVHLLTGKQEFKKGDVVSIAGELCESPESSWGSSEYLVWPESVTVGH